MSKTALEYALGWKGERLGRGESDFSFLAVSCSCIFDNSEGSKIGRALNEVALGEMASFSPIERGRGIMVGAACMEQDLHNLKDDMVAFIEGHGLRRFNAYIGDDVPSVPWTADEDHPDAWKDFVELAKASGVQFVTMNQVDLDKEDVDLLLNRLQEIEYMNEEDLEEARWLRNFVGKVGFVQLGFPCQGVVFVYEIATPWYETFRRLEEAADDYDGILIDDSDQEEE